MSSTTTRPRAAVFLATTGEGVIRARRPGWAGGEATAAEESGLAWQVERLLPRLPVRCLALDPAGGLWAGTQGAGVLRSVDQGATWRPAGLEGRIVKSLAASRDGVVYAGLKSAGVAVTRDGGETWEELEGFRRIRGRRFWLSPAEPPGTAYVQGLAVSPEDPELIVAGIEFGAVVRSEDGGRTWSGHRRGALRDCHSLTFHATAGSHVYEGGAGLRRPFAHSRDGGATWTSPAGASLSYGWACAADPGDPETVYVSATRGPGRAHGSRPAQARIYRSRGGSDWERLGGGLPDPLDAFPYALLTDPAAPGHLYAGLADGTVWFTPDHGDAWERLPVELGRIERVLLAV
jgi:hypothetical protein